MYGAAGNSRRKPAAVCARRAATPAAVPLPLLQGANRHLRERLADALQELDAAHAQLRILQGLQRQLEGATPDAADLVAVALEQERALQAARDAHVLQLLRAKVSRGALGRGAGHSTKCGQQGFLAHSCA